MASASEERWQAKISTVLERSKYMFNNPVMSDIKFAFPYKQIISAHKYVLAISSPVFFAMFYGDLAEKREAIDITDCDADIFLQFLRYIYCDDVNFRDVACAIQVWYLADKYDVPSLAGECVEFLDRAMHPLEALNVIKHAIHLNDCGLEKSCWEVIDYNAKEIVADDSFLELTHEFLLLFFERSSLRITEATLFEAVDRWAAKKCEEAGMTVDGANKRSVLGEDLLKLVRFPLMSPEEFSDEVLPEEILSTTEVIDLFKYFTSVPNPGGLKFSILPRIKKDVPLLSCSMGSWYPYTPAGPVRDACKTGVLTFTVSKDIAFCGVRIVTNDRVPNRPPHHVNLSVCRGGKKIRQIKDRSVRNSFQTHIKAFFNRPFKLYKNTCYTIETETDLTTNEFPFVWSESLQESLPTSTSSANDQDQANIVSGHCSGVYNECIPANVSYKGEISELLFEQLER